MKQCNNCGYYCSDATVNCPQCRSLDAGELASKKFKEAMNALEWIEKNGHFAHPENITNVVKDALKNIREMKLEK